MAKILLDTSVYIPLLKSGKEPGRILSTPDSLLYLSSVVAQELLAGALDGATVKALEKLCHIFQKNRRLLTPTAQDWILCGRTLSHIGRKYGFESIKKGRLINDVLIALNAKGIGATLITSNRKHFQMIRQFISFHFVGL